MRERHGIPDQLLPRTCPFRREDSGTEGTVLGEDPVPISNGKYSIADVPGEAIRRAREHVGKIDLLITDVVMPEMNGRDLARNLLKLYPGMKRLFMPGYTANVIAHQGVLDEEVNCIQKPFSMQDLGAKVREALDRN